MAELNKAAAAEEKALFLFDKGSACMQDGNYERATELFAASLALKQSQDTQQLYDMAREKLAERQQQQQQPQDTTGVDDDDDGEFTMPQASSSWYALGGRLFKEVVRRATSMLQSTNTNNNNTTTTTTTSTTARAGGTLSSYTEEQLADHVLSSKTYYQVLGLDRSTANEKDIKLAYRTMALKLHPDKSSLPRSGDAFRVLSNAYETLSTDALRSQYDWRLDHPSHDDEDYISGRAAGVTSAAVQAAGLARWFYAPRQPPTRWRQSRSCPVKSLYWTWYIAAFVAIVAQLLLGSAIILAHAWMVALWRELFSLQYVSLKLHRTRVEFWISLSTKCFISINGAVHEIQPSDLEKLILDMLEQQQQRHQQEQQQQQQQQQQHAKKKPNKGKHAHAQPTQAPPRTAVKSDGKGRNKKRR